MQDFFVTFMKKLGDVPENRFRERSSNRTKYDNKRLKQLDSQNFSRIKTDKKTRSPGHVGVLNY